MNGLRGNKLFLSAIDRKIDEHNRLVDEFNDVVFQTKIMPDGLDKIRALLVAYEIGIRRDALGVDIDYLEAKAGR